jgi:choline-sulfatase
MWLKNNLYEGAVHVPLVVSGPGLPKGKAIDSPVSHVDLVATMIELSGMRVPKELRGTSLMPLMIGKANGGPQFVYSESHSEGNPTGSCMIRKGDWKLIHFSYYSDCLFNLKEDPEEKHDRIDDPSVEHVVKELRSILHQQVDPEEVTERAFAAQDKILSRFVQTMDEAELFGLLRSRLGDGQARIMAKMLKKRGK